MEIQLQSLMTYTVFHIGVYVSLFSALMGMGIFGGQDHPILRFGVGCFLVAGICGAIVASNIPEYAHFKDYAAAELGPWGMKLAGYRCWATLEHLAFWLGVLPMVGSYIVKGPSAFKS